MALYKKDNPTATQEELAKSIGVSANTIRHWLRKPLYQSYENWLINSTYEEMPLQAKRRREDVQEDLDEFAQEMLDRLRDIAETSQDQKLVAQIGFDALDRAGYAAAKKDSARPINLIITEELLATIRQRAVESSTVEGVVVGQVEARP